MNKQAKKTQKKGEYEEKSTLFKNEPCFYFFFFNTTYEKKELCFSRVCMS